MAGSDRDLVWLIVRLLLWLPWLPPPFLVGAPCPLVTCPEGVAADDAGVDDSEEHSISSRLRMGGPSPVVRATTRLTLSFFYKENTVEVEATSLSLFVLYISILPIAISMASKLTSYFQSVS